MKVPILLAHSWQNHGRKMKNLHSVRLNLGTELIFACIKCCNLPYSNVDSRKLEMVTRLIFFPSLYVVTLQ